MKRILVILWGVMLSASFSWAQDFEIQKTEASPRFGDLSEGNWRFLEFSITAQENLFLKEISFYNDKDLEGDFDDEIRDRLSFSLYHDTRLLQTWRMNEGKAVFSFSNPQAPFLEKEEPIVFVIMVEIPSDLENEPALLRLRLEEIKVFSQSTGELFTYDESEISLVSGLFTINQPQSSVDMTFGPFGPGMQDFCQIDIHTPFPFAGMQFTFLDTAFTSFFVPTQGMQDLNEEFEYAVASLSDGSYGVMIVLKDPENIQDQSDYTFQIPFEVLGEVTPHKSKEVWVYDLLLSTHQMPIPNTLWQNIFYLDIGKKGNLTFPVDFRLEVTDYIRAKRVLLEYEHTSYERWASDMNGDEEITVHDFILLRNEIFEFEIPDPQDIPSVIQTPTHLHIPSGVAAFEIHGKVDLSDHPGWTRESSPTKTIFYRGSDNFTSQEIPYYGNIEEIKVSDQKGSDVLVEKGFTSVEENVSPSLWEIFPNPLQDQGTLRWAPEREISHLEILDLSGQKILEVSHPPKNGVLTIDTHLWTPGVYMVRIREKDQWSVKKWIKF